MGIATAYTAAAMEKMVGDTVVSGAVNSAGALILIKKNGQELDSGNVRGPQGIKGDTGIVGGTTVTRDTTYPLPTTTAAQVAMASKHIVWYNSDYKWFEIYAVPVGTAGLPANVAPSYTKYAGWVPIRHIALGMRENKLNLGLSGQRSATRQVLDQLDINVVEGRSYRIRWRLRTSSPAASMAMIAACRWDNAGVTSDIGGTFIGAENILWTAPYANTGVDQEISWDWVAVATGPLGLKFSIARVVGNSTYQIEKRYMSIEDVGVITKTTTV